MDGSLNKAVKLAMAALREHEVYAGIRQTHAHLSSYMYSFLTASRGRDDHVWKAAVV